MIRLFFVETEQRPSNPSGARQSPVPTGRGSTILVVEDDADMREVMEIMLQQLGCKIVLAESVEDARNVAAGESLGLIVSDLGLPGESGLSLLTALGLKGKVPAVALSGYSSDEDVMATREAGFTEHLVKPVTPDKLLEVVKRLMGK